MNRKAIKASRMSLATVRLGRTVVLNIEQPTRYSIETNSIKKN